MKPIEVIYKKPGEGKTTELIKRCAENGGVIVSANSMRARHTYEMAKNLGYEIPMPITHENLIDKYYDRRNVKKIYIDDTTELIQKITNGLEIEAITIDDLPDISERQLTKGQGKSNEELKPCPFCGGEVTIALGGDDTYKWYFITRGNRENKCDCRLFMESEKFHRDDGKETKMKAKNDLINRWNKRVFIIRR